MYRYAPTSNGLAVALPARLRQPTRIRSRASCSAWYMRACLANFPNVTFVLLESGVTWLPTLIWRAVKTWRGVRPEMPWVQRISGRSDPPAGAPDDPADRRPAGCRRPGAGDRADRLRRYAAVRHRLPALAVRRRRAAAGWHPEPSYREDHAREPARDVFPSARRPCSEPRPSTVPAKRRANPPKRACGSSTPTSIHRSPTRPRCIRSWRPTGANI